ncbi:MAG TPA: hypothetical protein VJ226_01970, partial [Bradyrhizobium sp.]|nr:hypothetical protein [Bradyrhizobium sp.]
LAALLFTLLPVGCLAAEAVPSVAPSTLPRIGRVDQRFQSYNIEMVEISGGRFWKPYRSVANEASPDRAAGAGDDAERRLFQYRPPIDLGNTRLRRLAAALGPAYVRVSGSWANSTYFADNDDGPASTPAGFKGVLTRSQWRGVIDFVAAVNGRLVTSFAVSAGSRDGAGRWKPDQARRLLGYTKTIGGEIAAAEFINEPDLAAMGGLPDGYDAAAYKRDFRRFRSLIDQVSPKTMILGPGAAGEGAKVAPFLAASRNGLDGFSYHYYGALSERCTGTSAPDAALAEATLAGTDRALAFQQALRDRFVPGRPIWLTETADAACGGNRSAVTFRDTFRYLDQLGRLAKAGVQVVMHNTLAASDYGLLDENTLQPRPNYWAAWLWRRLMGTTVLDAGVALRAGLHVYAHCQRSQRGGVSLLVINTDRTAAHRLALAGNALRYTLDAASLNDIEIRLNGRKLGLGASGELPDIQGVMAASGTATFDPASITFLVIPEAGNVACRRAG